MIFRPSLLSASRTAPCTSAPSSRSPTHKFAFLFVVFTIYLSELPTSSSLSLNMLSSSTAKSDPSSSASLDSSVISPLSTTRRAPTLRSFQSSISSLSDDDETTSAFPMISERTQQMMDRASQNLPLTEDELQDIARSLQNVAPRDSPIDFAALEPLLKDVAHLSHKDWSVTSKNAEKLGPILLGPDQKVSAPHVGQLLERVLQEGNWQGAVQHVSRRPKEYAQPWAVLIAGCNGIRKTTAMYQPWFPQLLEEALDCPPSGTKDIPQEVLPCGDNSFFRQLDHMICTLCNEDFKVLYELTRQQLKSPQELDNPPSSLIKKYSDLKAAIFARYRTLSELLGGLLLQQAQQLNINCMVETSGKDVAMFHYVDHFFDNSGYNKLALHFQINDLTQAQASVDARMVSELRAGIEALDKEDMFDVIYANAGGPYGSEVLAEVQSASDSVWKSEVLSGKVGKDWYKASIQINAHPIEPWTAQAIKPDGSLGTKFTFERR